MNRIGRKLDEWRLGKVGVGLFYAYLIAVLLCFVFLAGQYRAIQNGQHSRARIIDANCRNANEIRVESNKRNVLARNLGHLTITLARLNANDPRLTASDRAEIGAILGDVSASDGFHDLAIHKCPDVPVG